MAAHVQDPVLRLDFTERTPYCQNQNLKALLGWRGLDGKSEEVEALRRGDAVAGFFVEVVVEGEVEVEAFSMEVLGNGEGACGKLENAGSPCPESKAFLLGSVRTLNCCKVFFKIQICFVLFNVHFFGTT